MRYALDESTILKIEELEFVTLMIEVLFLGEEGL